ncbi:MAG: PGPGW domain-containing protein [Sandaracinaceae bacterium]
MSVISKLGEQWKAFKHDQPGHRFERQRERMQQAGRGLLIALVVLGSLLVAGGGVLLFVPGPGLLLIVFGLALIAGVSKTLARLLDRAEPRVRSGARRVKAWWREASVPVKSVVIGSLVLGAAASAFGVYRVWLA